MQTYYDLYKNLHHDLLILDKERKRKIYFVAPVGLVCFVLGFYLSGFFDLLVYGFPDFGDSIFSFWGIQVAILIALGWVYSKLKNYMDEYTIRFKKQIVEPILSSLADEVVHHPERKFSSKEEIVKSGFVFETVNWIEGEDLVKGKMEGIDFAFSEIEAGKSVKTSKGTNQTTLLEGIFFMATFPEKLAREINIHGRQRFIHPLEYSIFKYLPTNVVILLATLILGGSIFLFQVYSIDEILGFFYKRFILCGILAIAFIGSIFRYIHRTAKFFFKNNQLVKMDMGNISLEENYTVYSKSPSDVKPIQSKQVQAALVDFQKKTATSASIHIRNEKVYIFVPKSFDIFEPKWFKKNTDPKVIQESYEIIKGFYDIVVALKATQL